MVRGNKRVTLIKRFHLINKDLIGEEISNLANRLSSLDDSCSASMIVNASLLSVTSLTAAQSAQAGQRVSVSMETRCKTNLSYV